MNRVVTLGETMGLITSTGIGQLQHAKSATIGVGGSESNFAIAFQRLGGLATWIGKVGTDSVGDLVIRELRGEGLTIHAIRDSSSSTSLMIKERRTATDTRVWYYRKNNAGSKLQPEDLNISAIKDADLLHLTGISPALSESMNSTIHHAISIAQGANVPISFDLNFRAQLWSKEEARKSYLKIIPEVDYVFAGEEEARIAVGDGSGLELAHKLTNLGPSEAIVKLGARGIVAVSDGKEHSQEAIPVQVVDTVGAGDGSVAGYLYEALNGREVSRRLLTAASVGAYACLVESDWEGFPRLHEIDLLHNDEPVFR